MPAKLKRQIVSSLKGRSPYKGRTAEESAYAIMNSMEATRGGRITEKGRKLEQKLGR